MTTHCKKGVALTISYRPPEIYNTIQIIIKIKEMSDFGPDDFGGDQEMLDNLGSGNEASAGKPVNENDNIRMTSVTDNILGANAFGD